MQNQSDREPGVFVHDGQKERIPGQRHDLNKCTLHADIDDLGKLVVARIQAVDGVTRTLTCPVMKL